MDALAALALQIEWGADEALAERPLDRRATLTAPVAAPPAAAFRPPEMPVPPVLPALERAHALAAGAADLAALRTALAGFDGCALRATATSLVFGEGDPASPLVLIADVPGPAEDRSGLPFAGPGGVFLDRMLASIGLSRGELYATSLLPWRPPGDRKPAETEIQQCLPFLWRHLALLQPRRVVILGALAGRTLLPLAGRRARGWHALAVPGLQTPVPALALGSPATIQATPTAKREAWAAWVRLRRAMDADLSSQPLVE